MSKELEAFNRIWEDCSQLDLDYVSKHNLMDDLREIKTALEQAQKQQKLIELYKEVNNKSEELIALAEHDSWSWKLYHGIKNIQYKIKDLETSKSI